MRIGLVLPWTNSNRYSLAALVGAVETHPELSDVKVLIAKGDLRDTMQRANGKFDKFVIGFSFMTPSLPHVMRDIEGLKRCTGSNRDKLILVAGGAHPTGDPFGCLRLGFDVVMLGEGESTLTQMLLKIKKDKPIGSLKGIAFVNKGKMTRTPKPDPIVLNGYPPFALRHRLLAPIEISRGCPFVCYFCETPRIHGFRMRHRSVSEICKYLRFAARMGKRNTWFISPNAFAYGSPDGRRTYARKVLQLLKAIRKIPKLEGIFFGTFPSEVRPEFVTNELVSAVAEYCNNKTLTVGGQSGSQRLLDYVHRDHTVEDVQNAVQIIVEHGLVPHVDIIFGLPTENAEDRCKTRQLTKFITDNGGKIHCHIFMPLPGTPLETAPAGKIDPEDRKYVEGLITKGKADGFWAAQEKIAIQVCQSFAAQKNMRRIVSSRYI